ncbi:MAG: SprB repeat-containing protein [Flavobacteriales bacterium]
MAVAASAQLTVNLSASNYNGFNISCFGKKDGSIDATVSGGTPPYAYFWSNGLNTEDIADLASGYYSLKVVDAANTMVVVDITLVEPQALALSAEPFKYPDGNNISRHNCFNGSIDVTVTDGVPPYGYTWDDGPTTQDHTGLGARAYSVLVTDANGCEAVSQKLLLTQPERSDWTMNGNTGTNPATHYIGTADAQDVVFKSNGQERLRLLSTGDLKVSSPLLHSGPVYLDGNGVLRSGFPVLPPVSGLCLLLGNWPYWETRGNSFDLLCPDEGPVLGTTTPLPLIVITNDVERMRISTDGKVGIGTWTPDGPIDRYRLFVEDGIATREVLLKTGPWPDFVFDSGYDLMPLSELRAFVQRNRHLPGIPTASEVEADGGVEVGDLQRRMLETIEQQALCILQLEERLQQLEQRVTTLQTSK